MPIARGIVYNGRDAYHDRVYVRPKVEIVIKIVIRSCDRNCDSNTLIGSTKHTDCSAIKLHLSLCMYMHRSTLVYIYIGAR